MRPSRTVVRWIGSALVGAVVGCLPALAGSDRWIHVRIIDGDGSGETVRVNLPIDMLEAVVPLLDARGLESGRVRLGEGDAEEIDLRAVWRSLRRADDGEYVTIEGPDERVRIAKSDGLLVARIEGREGGQPQKITVTVPLEVVGALFSGDGEELDVAAALRELGERADGDLVRIQDGESRIRVWVDDDQDGRD